MEMLKTAVLITLLVAGCSALPLDQEDNQEGFQYVLETVVKVVHDTMFDSHLFTAPTSLVIGPFLVNVTRSVSTH